MITSKKVAKCRCCGGENFTKYLDLGNVPPCNALLQNQFEVVDSYPIEVMLCDACHLSQLSVVVNPEILYKNYPYSSSVSQTFREHCRDLAKKLRVFWHDRTILDIASNDGCLLKEFRDYGGFKVYGVEPSESFVERNKEDKIPVVQDFWSKGCLKGSGFPDRFDFITALNVIAHVDDLKSFVKNVYEHLSDDGIFVGEVPYLPNLINNVEFDTIYHEHLSYFLLLPLLAVFSHNGLTIYKVEKIPIHGGSIRIYARKKVGTEFSVIDMLNQEENDGFYSIAKYRAYADKVTENKGLFLKTLNELKGKKIVGLGASAKGISLLNYCQVEKDSISFIADDTLSKQGKLTPGSMIRILKFDDIEMFKPDYLILLAWNFKEDLMKKTRHLGARYIVPIPRTEII